MTYVIQRIADGRYYGGSGFWCPYVATAKTFRFKTIAELHGTIAIDLPLGAWHVLAVEG